MAGDLAVLVANVPENDDAGAFHDLETLAGAADVHQAAREVWAATLRPQVECS